MITVFRFTEDAGGTTERADTGDNIGGTAIEVTELAPDNQDLSLCSTIQFTFMANHTARIATIVLAGCWFTYCLIFNIFSFLEKIP